MNLLGLKDLKREEILDYLRLADRFVDAAGRPATPDEFRDALDGRPVGLLFFEPSTRTRVSFELAVRRLGGYATNILSERSSIEKGETAVDTCQNLEAMGIAGLIIRHADRHVPFTVAEQVEIPVLNAGNGTGEHPTQALIDVFTLRRALGRDDSLEGVTVAIIGDIIHSRVARSDVYALRALGARVVLSGPQKLLPMADEGWDAEVVATRREALAEADAVVVLRIQTERMHRDVVDSHDYTRDWGIDAGVAADEMRPGAFIMHPGPVIRGMELTSEVADGPRSLILQQAGNGVAIRQAVLIRHLTGR